MVSHCVIHEDSGRCLSKWSVKLVSSNTLLLNSSLDEWRIPIVEAGFLASVINLDIPRVANKNVEFVIQIMRFVGNAVAYCGNVNFLETRLVVDSPANS